VTDASLPSSATTIAAIFAGMALVASIEIAIPLHARGRWNRAHLGPNLALTLLAIATSAILNTGLLLALGGLRARGFGVLQGAALPPLLLGAIAVVVLDFSFYVAHVSMHKVPLFWRFHRVHHSDPAVDVTTTIRQHPGESVIRYAFLSAFAAALGAPPAAFAVYRAGSALNGLLEHASLRAPAWLDALLSRVTTWPHFHKVHHSRRPEETDTNYGNLFSVFDRLFRTSTPSARGANVAYGLEGFDDAAAQTTRGLLAMPFVSQPFARGGRPRRAPRSGGWRARLDSAAQPAATSMPSAPGSS
jgi:sterol desaturase/sphingolipid hydroxylase (fatty acid hydroxylase superfamily)